MKKGRRLWAVLLSLVITLTYMPALAFADDGDAGSGEAASVVAKIGSENYNSLEEAFSAANAATTATKIIMVKDTSFTGTIEIHPSKTVTLELAGCTITSGNDTLQPLFKLTKGTLVVNDGGSNKGGISGTGIIFRLDTLNESSVTSSSGASITINKDVNVTSDDSPCVMIRGYGTVKVMGNLTSSGVYATIQGNGSDAQGSKIEISGRVKSNESNAIYHPQAGNLTVKSGAEIEGASSGIAIKAGKLNILGGTIKATGESKIPTEGWSNGINASGCAVQIESNTGYNADGVSVNISGGTLESQNAVAVYEYLGKGTETKLTGLKVTGGTFKASGDMQPILLSEEAVRDKVTAVSGGSFSSKIPAEFCASGYEPVSTPNSDGMYGVQVAEESAVASISRDGKTTFYLTVNSAMTNAESGDEVVVLKDESRSNSNGAVVNAKAEKSVTLNLNGHKIEQQSSKQATIYVPGKAGTELILKGPGTVMGSGNGIKAGAHTNVSIDENVSIIGGTNGVYVDGGQATLSTEGTITGSEAGIFITGAGSSKTISIMGGEVSGPYGVYSCQGAIVNLSDGTITGTTAAIALNGYQAYAPDSEYTIKLNVTGGSIIGTGDAWAIAGLGTKDDGNYEINILDGVITSDSCAIYHCNDGVLNVSGGSISGTTAIYQKSGSLAINGGTITGTGASHEYSYYGNGANATGDAIVIDNCGYPGGAPTAKIVSGTITSENARGIGSYCGNNVTDLATVIAESNNITVPADEMWVKNDEGSYSLVKADDIDVAQDNKIEALQDQVNDLQKQIDDNKAALEALNDTYATDEEVASKIAAAKTAIETAQQAINEAQKADIDALEAEINDAKTKLEAADTATLNAAKAYTDDAKTDLQEKINANKAALDALDDNYATDADVDKKIANAKKAIKDAQAAVDALQDKALTDKSKELTDALAAAEAALKQADAETLEAAKAYTDAAKKDLQNQIDTNKAALDALDDTYATDADVDKKIADAKKAIEDAQAAVDALQDKALTDKSKELTDALAAAEAALKQADADTLAASKAYTDAKEKALQAQIDELEGRLSKSEGDNAALNDQIKEIKAELHQTMIDSIDVSISAKQRNYKKIRVTWSTSKNRIAGKTLTYTVFTRKKGAKKWTELCTKKCKGNGKPMSFDVNNVDTGSYYQFRAVPSVEIDGNIVEGSESMIVSAKATLARTKITKALKGRKKVKITFKKVAGADGYQISYLASTEEKDKKVNVKAGKGKTITRTVKKLKARKLYFVKVRAYKVVNGKKVYGKWSVSRRVKTK